MRLEQNETMGSDAEMIVIFLFLSLFSSLSASAKKLNGFEFDNSAVPLSEIKEGGPKKDGIPAIDHPKFVSSKWFNKKSDKGEIYSKNERAVIFEYKGRKKIYPISILNWHEIVNDQIEDLHFTVSYSPLTGTALVFKTDKKTNYSASGLIYNSGILMYDRESASLWSQLKMEAISGKKKGAKLTPLRSETANLFSYLEKNSDALLLSQEIQTKRPYKENPYEGYSTSDNLYFPVKKIDSTYPPKTWSILLINKKGSSIIPITKAKTDSLSFSLNGEIMSLEVQRKRKTFSCKNIPKDTTCISGYWFALKAFFPDSQVPDLDDYKPINDFDKQ